MALNPNDFDFFKAGEAFPYIKSKQSTNEMDIFSANEVFQAVLAEGGGSVTPPAPPATAASRNRFFLID